MEEIEEDGENVKGGLRMVKGAKAKRGPVCPRWEASGWADSPNLWGVI